MKLNRRLIGNVVHLATVFCESSPTSSEGMKAMMGKARVLSGELCVAGHHGPVFGYHSERSTNSTIGSLA